MGNGLALGVDLGGTKIYSIITDKNHHVLADAKMSTTVGADPDRLAQDILAVSCEAAAKLEVPMDSIEHIGVAVPTSVDPVSGDCLCATNLGLSDFSMKDRFCSLFKRRVYFGNDGNLGILGEYHCGAAKGFHSAIGYYVGTGLGGGIILNGKLYQGNAGAAGEFGHAIIKHGGRRCGCGHRGCAEAYCSKIAFVKALKKEVFKRGGKTVLPSDKFNPDTRNIKSKQLAKAYAVGDPSVSKVINHGAYMLGVAAAGACAVLAPECIILGGGVISSLGIEMFPIFKASFDAHLFCLKPDSVQLRLSVLGDSSVALGASILARNKGDC